MSGFAQVCCRFPHEHRLYKAMGVRCPCFPKRLPILFMGQPLVISSSNTLKKGKKTKKRG